MVDLWKNDSALLCYIVNACYSVTREYSVYKYSNCTRIHKYYIMYYYLLHGYIIYRIIIIMCICSRRAGVHENIILLAVTAAAVSLSLSSKSYARGWALSCVCDSLPTTCEVYGRVWERARKYEERAVRVGAMCTSRLLVRAHTHARASPYTKTSAHTHKRITHTQVLTCTGVAHVLYCGLAAYR